MERTESERNVNGKTRRCCGNLCLVAGESEGEEGEGVKGGERGKGRVVIGQ